MVFLAHYRPRSGSQSPRAALAWLPRTFYSPWPLFNPRIPLILSGDFDEQRCPLKPDPWYHRRPQRIVNKPGQFHAACCVGLRKSPPPKKTGCCWRRDCAELAFIRFLKGETCIMIATKKKHCNEGERIGLDLCWRSVLYEWASEWVCVCVFLFLCVCAHIALLFCLHICEVWRKWVWVHQAWLVSAA